MLLNILDSSPDARENPFVWICIFFLAKKNDQRSRPKRRDWLEKKQMKTKDLEKQRDWLLTIILKNL